jgi:intracellular sulfur oxidation DsrE/DsrF family protein
MKRIKSNYNHLQVLKTSKARLRKAIIKTCDSELVKTISECVLNVLRGNVTLAACQNKLQQFKVPLRSLADKKRLKNQGGGFIVPLLSAILPTIASLIFR